MTNQLEYAGRIIKTIGEVQIEKAIIQSFLRMHLLLVEEETMHLLNRFTKVLALDGVQVEANQKGLIITF
jgi:hypothetical protein